MVASCTTHVEGCAERTSVLRHGYCCRLSSPPLAARRPVNLGLSLVPSSTAALAHSSRPEFASGSMLWKSENHKRRCQRHFLQRRIAAMSLRCRRRRDGHTDPSWTGHFAMPSRNRKTGRGLKHIRRTTGYRSPELEQVGCASPLRSRDGTGRIVQIRTAASNVAHHLAQPQKITRFSSLLR